MKHTSSDIVRVFFAVWPDETGRRTLSEWPLPYSGRMMAPDTLHVTLVFLGEVDISRLESLKRVAGAVVAQSFELCFDELRYWSHNRIVCAAPRIVPVQLQYLVSELERRLTDDNFVFIHRDYQPHVTLMRNVQWRDEPPFFVPPMNWRVNEFVLLQSVHGVGEACYRTLATFRLE